MDDLAAVTAMSEALVARGFMTPETAAAELALMQTPDAGIDTPTLTTAISPPPGTRPPDVVIDGFEAPASPLGYRLSMPDGLTPAPEQEKVVRDAFYQAGVPTAMANEIDKQFHAGLANPQTEQQAGSTRAATLASLANIFGRDEVDRVLKVARVELQTMTKNAPVLQEMIDSASLGNNLYVIASLYNLATARGPRR